MGTLPRQNPHREADPTGDHPTGKGTPQQGRLRRTGTPQWEDHTGNVSSQRGHRIEAPLRPHLEGAREGERRAGEFPGRLMVVNKVSPHLLRLRRYTGPDRKWVMTDTSVSGVRPEGRGPGPLETALLSVQCALQGPAAGCGPGLGSLSTDRRRSDPMPALLRDRSGPPRSLSRVRGDPKRPPNPNPPPLPPGLSSTLRIPLPYCSDTVLRVL